MSTSTSQVSTITPQYQTERVVTMSEPPTSKRQKRENANTEKLPQKKHYRQRAHANVFSDHDLTYPISPKHMDWSTHFPAYAMPSADPKALAPPMQKQVSVADIGCGFGGLLFALAPEYPDKLMVGMEIRTSVSQYVIDKVAASRAQSESADGEPGLYQNISCVRANAMKFLPNFFPKASLTHLFFCFPDPQFKHRKHKARIVSTALNSEYAYLLAPGGRAYTITDVQDLHLWMVKHFEAHPSFKRVTEEELAEDKAAQLMEHATEESQKVTRNNGNKYVAVYERLRDDDA
ncbi:hypothetical protein AMS68_007925 [Peltaster fructicola]|uniref:tRNA (guanine-N(7)-)-methyltransferase n=1 Tax=Peltaster fructicola TaxID=286661 RepID=A0A6H0Y6C3_9PEZI|nr:hypothetical protein AMS68_007925 [Peltaster fructicola]